MGAPSSVQSGAKSDRTKSRGLENCRSVEEISVPAMRGWETPWGEEGFGGGRVIFRAVFGDLVFWSSAARKPPLLFGG